MKSKLLPLLFAFAASAPALAATLPVETAPQAALQDGDQPAAIAVASVCVTNKTDYRITYLANWGLDGERWTRLAVNPGDVAQYRLVLDAQRDATNLTLRFPTDPTSGKTSELAIPATWGTSREDDCTKLPSFDFVLTTTDGGDPVFNLVVSTPAQ